MSEFPLSREVALRIGLAARSLPDLDAGAMIEVLVDAVGLPLTEDKFQSLKVKDLRAAGDGRLAGVNAEELKAALRQLKGDEAVAVTDLPVLDAYEEGDMPGSIRVACASNKNEELDGHFGSCKRFLVYQVSPDELRLVDIRGVEDADEEDDKNAARAALVKDCQVLHVVSIGGPAAAKVVRTGVHPIKHPAGGAAREILADLQRVLAGSPPPWLARVMGREASTLDAFRQAALESE